MVGGGEERTVVSRVTARGPETGCLKRGCDDGGGVMDEAEPATIIEVDGEVPRGMASFEGMSAPIGCGVEGISDGVTTSSKDN
jgi:hypothetical protein